MHSAVYPYPIPTTALRWNRMMDALIAASCRFEQLVYEKAGFNPSQPRDYHGCWAETGASGTLSATETWGKPETLDEHTKRHGKDFGVNSAKEYAKRANDFYKRGQAEKLPTVIDKSGNIRVYDPKTNTFGAYNRNGTTRTFYKPPPNYFEGQISRYGPTGRVLNMPEGGGGGLLIDDSVMGRPMRGSGRGRLQN